MHNFVEYLSEFQKKTLEYYSRSHYLRRGTYVRRQKRRWSRDGLALGFFGAYQ
jgi:hypothetical protein